MNSLDAFAAAKLDALERRRLKRDLAVTRPAGGARVERGGSRMVSFCSNDYLGLAGDRRLREAAIRALDAYGAGAGAARLVTGNHPLFETLEGRIAAVKGTDDSCVFGSGYLANLGVIPAIAGREDLILIDALGHASMHTGARLTGGRIVAFGHNDIAQCRSVLERERARHKHCLILTEGVFGMDGDLGAIGPLHRLAEDFGAWLLVDDAHGFGVLGGGAGATREVSQVPPSSLLNIGTLSKAVGAYGGFLAASTPVCALIRNRARSFVYSTGLPASVIASAIAGIEAIETEPDRVARPKRHAEAFCAALGLPPPDSQIVPIVLGEPDDALAAADALAARGFLIAPIRPPTVPAGTARLRVTFSAAHSESDVSALATAMVELGLVAETAASAGPSSAERTLAG